MSVKFIPDGYHTITPYLIVDHVDKLDQLVEFLEAAFNATEKECVRNKDGRREHSNMQIGDSLVMLGYGPDVSGGAKAMLYLYVEDTDAMYHQAIKAGATSLMEPVDQFYGDRNAGVEGPCGHKWWIATHKEDLSPEELEKRAQAYYQEKS